MQLCSVCASPRNAPNWSPNWAVGACSESSSTSRNLIAEQHEVLTKPFKSWTSWRSSSKSLFHDLSSFPELCRELWQQQAQQSKAQGHSHEQQSSGSAPGPLLGSHPLPVQDTHPGFPWAQGPRSSSRASVTTTFVWELIYLLCPTWVSSSGLCLPGDCPRD